MSAGMANRKYRGAPHLIADTGNLDPIIKETLNTYGVIANRDHVDIVTVIFSVRRLL